MTRRAARLLGTVLAGLAGTAQAQSLPPLGPAPDAAIVAPTAVPMTAPTTATPQPAVIAPSPATPNAPGAGVPMPARAVSLQAGTGTLLRLPQPAAAVMSAQPAVARVQPASPTTLFLMAVAPGRTTLIATDENGQPIIQYDVTVTPVPGQPPPGQPLALPPAGDAAQAVVTPEMAVRISTAIAQMVPGAADIGVAPSGHAAVLRGSVPSASAAAQAEAIAHGFLGAHAQLIDQLQVLGRLQVNVRVRVAEIDRQITRELGFNWQALGSIASWRLGLLSGTAAGGGALSPASAIGITPLGNTPAGQIGASYSSGGANVASLIDALAADQLITILAEPNLTALSGETASFLAGGEFPIPVAGYANGNGSVPEITVQFQQYGVSLAVVPTVLSDNRLNLRIRPEVSELSTQGAVSVPIGNGSLTIPALTVRRAETTVELGSGESFAIAGLLQRTSTDLTNAIPGLGETPVLGALFKSNSFQRGETELVIVVTPYIVRPAKTPAVLQMPTDGFVPATDLDRVLLGRQLAPGAGTPPLNAGFILK